MAQRKDRKHCGKCGGPGHSMRTCVQIKAVSAARLKEVLAYGKAQNSNTHMPPGIGRCASWSPPPRKPNLLYVSSDKHRACSMPGGPLNEAYTPNLERFAR